MTEQNVTIENIAVKENGMSSAKERSTTNSTTRGFARMRLSDPKRLHEIASKGGQASANARKNRASKLNETRDINSNQ